MSNKKESLLQNIIAGFSVSFVALSLGAAFGILSGRGAFVGMLSAALIAIITSIFGGTRVQCSGPTAPMTTITAVVVAFAHDYIPAHFSTLTPDQFITVVFMLTAFLLILAGLLRLGKFITYVPNVVISGFMNGIAILIWLDQIKKIVGIGGKVAYMGPLWENIFITVASVVLVFVLPKIFSTWMPKFASFLSGTFLTIVIMTGVAWLFQMPVEHVQLSMSLRSFSDFAHLVTNQWPTQWGFEVWRAAVPFALQLLFLAYLDTLLTSLVVDKMTKETTKQDKELVAQGLANGVAGIIGGIPGAQATIRSVLIIKEKATSRFAGILVGVFALVEMLLFQNTINLIPQTVFAGILFKVGYDVFDWTPLRLYVKEWIHDKNKLLHDFFSRHDDEAVFVTNREFMMIAGTALVTTLWNLNMAVLIFSVLFYVHNALFKSSKMRDLVPETETEGFSDEM